MSAYHVVLVNCLEIVMSVCVLWKFWICCWFACYRLWQCCEIRDQHSMQ